MRGIWSIVIKKTPTFSLYEEYRRLKYETKPAINNLAFTNCSLFPSTSYFCPSKSC
jgi:hypothetical protein